MLLASLRWLGAVLLLFIFATKILVRDWSGLRTHLGALFLMGSMGVGAFSALFYVAAYTTSALNIGIIQGSVPVFVLIGALVIYRTAISGLQIVGVALTIIGVLVITSAGDLTRLASFTITRGDYLMVLACLLYAGYVLALRRFTAVSSLSLFAVVGLSAFIMSIPLSMFEFATGNLQWPTTQGWVIVVLVTILPSFLAQILFIQGVAAIGPGRAGMFVNLVPVFASILAVSILSEPFNGYHGIALALVVGGIWLSERKNNCQT